MKKLFAPVSIALAMTVGFWACLPESTVPDPVTSSPTRGARQGADKVAVGHKTGKGFKVIKIGSSAVADHLAHGDFLAADFATFYIRNNNAVPLAQRISPPWDTDIVLSENTEGDGFTARTPKAGQKVGYGTNALDGMPINQISTVKWDRVSGMINNVVAYLNIWVTDGTNYAIIASENNYPGTDFTTRREWKVFEHSGSNLNWLFDSGSGASDGARYLTRNGVRVTLSELASHIIIKDPGNPYPSYVGNGAPRGGYGFNLIWGDTQTNFTGGSSTIPNQLENLTLTINGDTYHAVNF